MSLELTFALQTIFEILMVVLILYGFVHEKKLIRFEKKLKLKLAKILYKILLNFHKEEIKK